MEKKLSDYLLIKEAAQFLGVSEGTLRNWSRDGNLPTYRNPINGYRMYRRADLEKLLADVSVSGQEKPRSSRSGGGK